jgi:hypothetical protein
METFWRQWADPRERLKWVQQLVTENQRHPFAFLWRSESWAGGCCEAEPHRAETQKRRTAQAQTHQRHPERAISPRRVQKFHRLDRIEAFPVG